MTEHTSQFDLPIDPDHDQDHVSDGEKNAAPVDEQQKTDDDADDDAGGDELAENPTPAQRDAPPAKQAAPAAPAATAAAPGGDAAPTKRGPGRPRKAATPAKKDAPAQPGADVTPKAPARSEQVEQVRGLLQLRASAIGSIACQLAGWPPLTSEEGALIDAEFEGWEAPPELRKAVVLGLVVLPRAAADNRLRRLVGLGPVDGGDAPEVARQQIAQQRAELERQQAELARAQAQLRQQAEPAKQAAPAQAPAPVQATSKRRPAPAQQRDDGEPVKIVIPEGFI